MNRLRIVLKSTLIGLLVLQARFTATDAKRSCNVKDLTDSQCDVSEVCLEDGSCDCLPGYVRLNSTNCFVSNQPKKPQVSPTPNYSSLVHNEGNGSLVAGLLIPLFLIIIVICAVYASKKYKILHWIRNKIQQRNQSYDEFMIGQDDDDPPLA